MYLNRITGYFILILLISILLPQHLFPEEPEIIRVGIYDNYPKVYINEKTQVSGIYPEILEEIADLEKWQLEYVIGSWNECLERLGKAEIDIMVDVGYSEERHNLYAFNDETLFINWAVIYTKGKGDINSIPDLAGRKIAVMSNSVHTTGATGIYSLVEQYGIEAEFEEVENYREVFELLAANEVDAGIVNRIFGNEYADEYGLTKTNVVFNPIQLRFAFPADSPASNYLIERIDTHLRTMQENTGSVYYQILSKYNLCPKKHTPRWLIPVMIVLIGIIILISFMNFLMKWQIRIQTDVLKKTNAELQEEINLRREALVELEASRSKYRDLVEGASDAIISTDLHGRILSWNRAARDIFGYPEQEVLGRKISLLLCETQTPLERIRFFRKFFTGKINSLQTEAKISSGKHIYIELSVSTLTDQDNNKVSYLTIVRDITAKLSAEAALRRSEEKFRTFVENIPGLVYMYDQLPDGKRIPLLTTNRNDEFIGTHLSEEVNSDYNNFFNHIVEEDAVKLQEKAAAIETEGGILDLEYRIRLDGDKIKWFRSIGRVKPLHDGITRWQGVMIDIEERKRAEAELEIYRKHLEDLVDSRTRALQQKTESLEKAYHKLQESDQLKSVFLASMSHELRTPLNSIIGFTGILLMGMVGELNSEQRKQLNIVKQSSHHLLDLINDILDISKIEAGKVELDPESFLLAEVTAEVINIMRPKADEKNLQLINTPSDEITVQTDRRRLKQVILNLVSNAIKFTNAGEIVISTDLADADTVKITVEDSGIGISKNDLFKLFEPFQQVDNSLTKKQEGTGLGLHLSHRLMELLGGKIEVNSTVNKGSVFTIILPVSNRENSNV